MRPRRLSPWTIVVATGRNLGALLVAALAGLVVGGTGAGLVLTVLAVIAGLTRATVRWLSFRYVVHPDRIELRHTLLRRSVKNIPVQRIRGVDVSTTLLHRLLGLAVVHIDAGAGRDGRQRQDDGRLDAVRRGEAERVRAALVGADAAAGPAAGTPDTVHARATPRWFLYAPLSGAYLLTPFALAGSLAATAYNLGDDFGLITAGRLQRAGELASGLLPLFLLLLIVAMPVGSVIGFALFNWDFTLRSRPGANGLVVAERGLLTRRSVSIERRRIRGVALRDNPLERLAGVTRLDALVTGLGGAEHRGRLLPAVPAPLATSVASRLLGGTGPLVPPLLPHPPAARRRRVVRAALPLWAAAAMAFLAERPGLAALLAVLSLAAIPLGLDRYRQLGHASGHGRLSLRSGSLRRHHVVIEHRAVVGWRVGQTLFQRRLGLATLEAAVGAGHGGYAAIDMCATEALAFAAEITPDWITPFLVPEPATRPAVQPATQPAPLPIRPAEQEG